MKRLGILALALVLSAALLGGAQAQAAGKIVVGAKNFTEQYVLGNMLTLVLEDHGFDVTTRMGTGSTVTRKALETGQIGLYPEYTGTAWLTYLGHEKVINDPQELYRKVKAEDSENGILWFAKAPLNNTYALAIREKDVDAYGSTLSELAAYNNAHPEELVFGMGSEFYERADGFFAMAELYGFEINKSEQIKLMELGLTFEAIDRNQIDVAMTFATDGKIPKFNLVVLEDDKNFFPPYNISVCANQKVVDKYPELKEIFPPIMATLDNETMQRLNYEVDVEGKPARMVAEMYLKEKGFLQ
ncbi:MAG: glycine/betaine ABC transporter substrate-binding protein [Synergistales bacterium]|nr:glycine/betaine ABC transporter substrate-binding protein [Synergistales bacterium]